MMVLTANELKKEWINWAKESFTFKELGTDGVRIDTPFFDRHNDSLILYALPYNDGIKLTDAGYTIDDLGGEGIFLNHKSERRLEMAKSHLTNFAVNWDRNTNELYTVSESIFEMPDAKFRLIQAMLFINDMFMLRKTNVKSLFLEDVTSLMNEKEYSFISPHIVRDRIGMTHTFDFNVPGNVHKPDKVIKLLSSTANDVYAKAIVTDFSLLNDVATRKTNNIVLIDDTNKEMKTEVISLFNQANITPYSFMSDKDDFLDALA